MLFREKNIENIELLVHPLYDALYGVVWNIFDISKEEFLEVLKKVKKEDVGKYLFKNYKIREKRKKQIKVTLGVYGKKITTINPENSLLCVIKPNFEYSPISKHINYLEYTYNHFLNRLISFSEKKKMKINVSSWNDFYNKESLKKEAIGEKYFKKLKNSLNIYAFGEYDTLCVKSWRNQFVDRLIESKFKIRECLILNRFSYSANSIFSSSLEGFNFKTFYTRRQRKDKKRELSYRGFTKEEVREASRKKITFKRRK